MNPSLRLLDNTSIAESQVSDNLSRPSSSRPHRSTVHAISREIARLERNRDRQMRRDALRVSRLNAEADKYDGLLRQYRDSGAKEKRVKGALKQQWKMWKRDDTVAAEAFEAHLGIALAAARTSIRIFAIAAWFGGLPEGVRKALLDLLEYYHGEASLMLALRRAEVREGASASILREEMEEVEHAEINTRIEAHGRAHLSHASAIEVVAFAHFGTGSDMAAVGDFDDHNVCILVPARYREMLLKVQANFQARKALLHAGHPKHLNRVAFRADSVQAQVMTWCIRAFETLTKLLPFIENDLPATEKTLYRQLLNGLDKFSVITTYDAIDKMQDRVKEYLERYQNLSSHDDESVDSEDEHMVTEEEVANQTWLEEQEVEFIAFEKKYGPVLGTEWRKGAMMR